MINLEVPRRLALLAQQANEVAKEVFRPISRRYDREEHVYPKELDMLAAVMEGMEASGEIQGAGAQGVRRERAGNEENRNGSNMSTLLGLIELAYGDVGLLLSLPRQGLGNAAIASVANEEQLARFSGLWAAMAITEPEAGSDSAAIKTTARLEGDQWVLNGEKIYVTAGQRADLLVVWATLDPSKGRAAIKPFVVEKDAPGLILERLEEKLGIRASDTAAFRLENCRIPKENLLGSPEVEPEKGFGGVKQTFDNTRPLVAGMAVGLARAALEETQNLLAKEGIQPQAERPGHRQPGAAARLLELEAEYEAARLLALKAAWMADNQMPNSLQASMAKAKAGRSCVEIALSCVELCAALGYSEELLLEKWARDAKILDIFEGTQQIQLLIVARQLLGKSSNELR